MITPPGFWGMVLIHERIETPKSMTHVGIADGTSLGDACISGSGTGGTSQFGLDSELLREDPHENIGLSGTVPPFYSHGPQQELLRSLSVSSNNIWLDARTNTETHPPWRLASVAESSPSSRHIKHINQ